jgi:Fe-S cluster assembly protein SufD
MSERTVTRKEPEIRRKVSTEFQFKHQDVVQLSNRLSEPEWMKNIRLQAWKAWEDAPMPSNQDEAWRRTDLKFLPADSFQLGRYEDLEVEPKLLQPLADAAHGVLMVLRPGAEVELSGFEPLDEMGIVFKDWPSAVQDHPDLVQKYAGQIVSPEEGKFAALSAALSPNGVVVYIPPGVKLNQPLHSVLWAPAEGAAHLSRVLVVLGVGAEATFIHETASPTDRDRESMHAGTVELIVGANARLTFIELQNWGPNIWNITHERAKLGRDANLDWIFGSVGSRLTKNFSEITLTGEGANGRMSGFYFADKKQHLDHDTQQNHMAPNTTSDLLFKGALIDQSRSVWQGMIYVAPGAQKTDGYQANRNLILSNKARADSIPGLEIMADDVRCTHGATVSQLEEEPIFYLMSRGLRRREAERLVVDGFFAPIMERIPFEGVRERLQEMVDSKLGE